MLLSKSTVVNHSTDTQFWNGSDEKWWTPNSPVAVILYIYIMFLDIQYIFGASAACV